jgi:hypothetical protein
MRKAVRWIVPALVSVVVAAVALIVLGAIASGSKHATSTSTRASTSSPAVAAPATRTKATHARPPKSGRRRTPVSGVPRRGRCGEITVNQYMSCAFARVVVKDYDEHPSASFLARSPVTGVTYTMQCEQARGVVACHDNSTSTLAFSRP